MFEVAGAIIGPMVATFLAAVGIWLKDWRGRRDAEQDQQQALTRAAEEVAFIEAWARASELVAEPAAHGRARAILQADLARAYLVARPLFSAYADVGAGVASERTGPLRVLRILFLARRLQSRTAKVIRVVYYVALLWALLWTAAISSVIMEDEITVVRIISAIFVLIVFGIAPAVVLGTTAGLLDRRGVRRSAAAYG